MTSARSAIRARWSALHASQRPPESRIAKALARRWPKDKRSPSRMEEDVLRVAADSEHPQNRRALDVLLRELDRLS